MNAEPVLLTTEQMAEFVAHGCLRFDGVVPDDINRRGIDEIMRLWTERFETDGLSPPETGTPLSQCYPPPSAIGEFLRLPVVQGLITSLLGPDPTFDHDWTHYVAPGHPVAQHLHIDALVDSADPTFDIQLFWFPHEVGPGEGGTRFVPGSHLHRTHSEAIEAYQHVKGEQEYSGPAGTVLVFHHGLWHSGRPNPSAKDRVMHKIRLNPSVPQVRHWDTSDLDDLHNTPTDHQFATTQPGRVASTFRAWQPWLGTTAHRHELVQRARLWRYLTGDDRYDVDHYLTRLEGRASLVESSLVESSLHEAAP